MHVEIEVTELNNGWTVKFRQSQHHAMKAFIEENMMYVCERIKMTLSRMDETRNKPQMKEAK